MASSITKDGIRQSYDTISHAYLDWSLSRPSPRLRYLENFVSQLASQHAQVLEVGCGAGYPVTETLSKNEHIAKIVANDISAVQIQLARGRLSDAVHAGKVELVEDDMTALTFDDESFDGVLAIFSIFHLPRHEQLPYLRKVHDWLKPGGLLLLNFATQDNAEIKNDFFDAPMLWSSFGVEGSKAIVLAAGFEVIKAETEGASTEGIEPDDPDYGKDFLWVIARKSGKGGG